jgi:hypothetical protein
MLSTSNDFLIETESGLKETIYGSIIQHLNVCNRCFRNASHPVPMTLPGSESILCFREAGRYVFAKL